MPTYTGAPGPVLVDEWDWVQRARLGTEIFVGIIGNLVSKREYKDFP